MSKINTDKLLINIAWGVGLATGGLMGYKTYSPLKKWTYTESDNRHASHKKDALKNLSIQKGTQSDNALYFKADTNQYNFGDISNPENYKQYVVINGMNVTMEQKRFSIEQKYQKENKLEAFANEGIAIGGACSVGLLTTMITGYMIYEACSKIETVWNNIKNHRKPV